MRFAFLVAGGAPDGPAFPVPAVVGVPRHPRLQEVLPAPPGPSGEVAEGERRWQDRGALLVSVLWRGTAPGIGGDATSSFVHSPARNYSKKPFPGQFLCTKPRTLCSDGTQHVRRLVETAGEPLIKN